MIQVKNLKLKQLQTDDIKMYLTLRYVANQFGFKNQFSNRVIDYYIPVDIYSYQLSTLKLVMIQCQSYLSLPVDDAHYSISEMRHLMIRNIIPYLRNKLKIVKG